MLSHNNVVSLHCWAPQGPTLASRQPALLAPLATNTACVAGERRCAAAWSLATAGAIYVSRGLKEHTNENLKDLDLGYNEIKDEGACALAQVCCGGPAGANGASCVRAGAGGVESGGPACGAQLAVLDCLGLHASGVEEQVAGQALVVVRATAVHAPHSPAFFALPPWHTGDPFAHPAACQPMRRSSTACQLQGGLLAVGQFGLYSWLACRRSDGALLPACRLSRPTPRGRLRT
jgi:hypothetical protein